MRVYFVTACILFSNILFAEDFIFAEDSEREVVSSGHQFAEGMAWDRDGNFLFTDVPRSQLFRIDKQSGAKTLIDARSMQRDLAARLTWKPNGLALSLDGKTLLVAKFDANTVHGVSIDENSRLTGDNKPGFGLGDR